MTGSTIGAVIIGRNEGQRLINCLASMQGEATRLVYVDSGSTDNSVEEARKAGAEIVLLDTTEPFTAARARNAGFEALNRGPNPPDYVQFVDGDCTLEPGWLTHAAQALDDTPDIGIVTGWRAELHPEASVYNAMCDFEWHRPAGDIDACGGDMMVRRVLFAQLEGFNPRVIAAEDDEFCVRVRKSGHRVHRLPIPMTHHDAAMLHFSQWWQRAIRSGHGFGQVGDLHPTHFRNERRRVWLFGGVLPFFLIVGAVMSGWLLLFVLLLYLGSYIRTVEGLRKAGLPLKTSLHHSVLLFLSKFPNLVGVMRYRKRKRLGHEMEIIEYK
ncbi:glycosyltransferase [Alisedimentitalea sp. MJ-SS2]|uniref:glycosyltransferase n=1 Tax=Aliisedimentitalea sp. MJ-SS2 TaxID=3049795 RepID=UPI0029124B8D|nr:glycosyltransferase [Alisedimentitalea sp. MJ-SS2]MDU8926230.1 glycosyltransferase [Alisedimentitalea sp. MJ-SS2]